MRVFTVSFTDLSRFLLHSGDKLINYQQYEKAFSEEKDLKRPFTATHRGKNFIIASQVIKSFSAKDLNTHLKSHFGDKSYRLNLTPRKKTQRRETPPFGKM